MEGHQNYSPRAILVYLFDTYGDITPQQLQEDHKRFTTAWDPSTPFETVIKQIEDSVEYTAQGSAPISEPQIINNGYNLVFQTGLYERDCIKWN